jgi:hypothetical protein
MYREIKAWPPRVGDWIKIGTKPGGEGGIFMQVVSTSYDDKHVLVVAEKRFLFPAEVGVVPVYEEA